MNHRNHRPKTAKSGQIRALRPVVEGLEGRLLLSATSGDQFTYGSRITWSIVPDGTSLGGVGSNFVSTMNARFGAGNWQKSLQDAFAVWENVANVNFVQVSDDGSPTNAGNYQQGSPTIGDIRIGGMAQDSSVLGFCLLPPPANGGSDAGDIFLNTNQPWQQGRNYDLESVLIHEIGHSLGMAHSTSSTAVMYPYYSGVHQYVSSDDIAGVQSVWGARQEDGFFQGNGNSTMAHAADVSNFHDANNQTVLGPLDIASPAESYWFKVTTPSNASSNFTVQMQSSNLSELSPKFAIYDANNHGLVQVAASSSTYGATIAATIHNVAPNATYYIKASGSNSGSNGSGNYGLEINMGPLTSLPLVPPPNTQVAAQPDQGGGSTSQTTGPTAVSDPSGDSSKDDSEAKKAKHDKSGGGSSVDPPSWFALGSILAQGDSLALLPGLKLPIPNASSLASIPDVPIPSIAQIPTATATDSGTMTILTNSKTFVATLIDQAHPTGPA